MSASSYHTHPLSYVDHAWLRYLTHLAHNGYQVEAKSFSADMAGNDTIELLSQDLIIDMLRPLIAVPARKLRYKFAVAEALAILTGDDRVAPLAKLVPRIAAYSDNGRTFFGAYGPRYVEQLDYAIKTLVQNPTSRQAVINIWTDNPPITRDVPCTIALVPIVRDKYMHLQVFMRSSDAWTGLPYDLFSFSMIAYHLCGHLNHRYGGAYVKPGLLFLKAASAHIYVKDLEQVEQCLYSYNNPAQLPPPSSLSHPSYWQDPKRLIDRLTALTQDGVTVDHLAMAKYHATENGLF